MEWLGDLDPAPTTVTPTESVPLAASGEDCGDTCGTPEPRRSSLTSGGRRQLAGVTSPDGGPRAEYATRRLRRQSALPQGDPK
jgi:hypothetical protein